jgi:hypothetical protein
MKSLASFAALLALLPGSLTQLKAGRAANVFVFALP